MRRQRAQMIWFGIGFVLVASLATVGAVALMGADLPL